MAANRGATVFEVPGPDLLGDVWGVMRGGDGWPPVVGLVFVPVSREELSAWKADPAASAVLSECWILDSQEAGL